MVVGRTKQRVEEMSAATASLNLQAQELVRAVAVFQLDPDRAAA